MTKNNVARANVFREEPPIRKQASNAEKARALMAMIEGNGVAASQPAVPPERLRAWARELVQAVEAAKPGVAAPERATGAAAIPEPHRSAATSDRAQDKETLGANHEIPSVFRRPPPVLSPAPVPGNALCEALEIISPRHRPRPKIVLSDQPSPAMATLDAALPDADADPSGMNVSASAPAPGRRAGLESASARIEATSFPADTQRAAPSSAQKRARALIRANIDPERMIREHPAVIAVALLGRSSMDQAQAMRALPGKQVRAVHRVLREMEDFVTA